MAMQTAGRKALENGIGNLRDFAHRSVKGRTYALGFIVPTGRLPQDQRAALVAIRRPVYVVFSYETPIAWHVIGAEGWTIPKVTYSVTTSGHQGLISFIAHRTP